MQTVRDILLSLMAILVSAVCVVILYLVFTAGAALSELGNTDPAPLPSYGPAAECIGEEPLPADC